MEKCITLQSRSRIIDIGKRLEETFFPTCTFLHSALDQRNLSLNPDILRRKLTNEESFNATRRVRSIQLSILGKACFLGALAGEGFYEGFMDVRSIFSCLCLLQSLCWFGGEIFLGI